MFLILILVSLIFPRVVGAETFSLTMQGDQFDEENNLQVHIKASADRPFKIRPRVDPPQTLFIYANGEIFSFGSFWTEVPENLSELVLHAPAPFQTTDIWFEVQDTASGQVFATPEKQVYGFNFAQSYIRALNNKLF